MIKYTIMILLKDLIKEINIIRNHFNLSKFDHQYYFDHKRTKKLILLINELIGTESYVRSKGKDTYVHEYIAKDLYFYYIYKDIPIYRLELIKDVNIAVYNKLIKDLEHV